MEFQEVKEKFIDGFILDRPYRRIQLLINGHESSWKTDIKDEIIADEHNLRSFVSFIKKFLDSEKIDRPYSIYNAKREGLTTPEDTKIYIKDRKILEKHLTNLAKKL